jgi:hypothetical protein
MKKIIIIFAITITTSTLFPGYNCFKIGWDLKKKYDTKMNNPVRCYCNCIERKGTCQECGHHQQARPLFIIQTTKKLVLNETAQPLIQTVPQTLSLLFENYKKSVLRAAH